VVTPQAKREAVGILTAERVLGVTRACGLVGISRCIAIGAGDRSRCSSEAALPSSPRRSAAKEFRDAHASRRSADRVRETLENIASLTPDPTSIPN